MVVDRDSQNIKKDALKKIIVECQNAGYNLALTNPCFEFWLLLHVADIENYKKEDLVKNRRVNKKKRFIDKELSNILNGYGKSKLKFDKFMHHIPEAIRQAELLENDVDKIIDALGTNVHILVKNILGQ